MGREVVARYDTAEFGTLTGSFTWNGLDADVIIETGTALPMPTPSPMTVPRFSADITVRHMYRGVPVIVDIDHRLSMGDVNGTRCGYGHSADVQGVTAIVSRQGWPFSDNFPCNAVGLPVHICVGFAVCSEEFIFDGRDQTVDLNWPESAFSAFPFATAHFRQNGIPTAVTIDALSFSSAGHTCYDSSWPQRGDTPAATVSDLATFWPFGASACHSAGTEITVNFSTAEFGDLQTTFTWTGSDMYYDVVIPSAETPSPEVTTLPTPTATAASLPRAGGPPASGGAVELEVLALAGLAMAVGMGLLLRRRRSE